MPREGRVAWCGQKWVRGREKPIRWNWCSRRHSQDKFAVIYFSRNSTRRSSVLIPLLNVALCHAAPDKDYSHTFSHIPSYEENLEWNLYCFLCWGRAKWFVRTLHLNFPLQYQLNPCNYPFHVALWNSQLRAPFSREKLFNVLSLPFLVSDFNPHWLWLSSGQRVVTFLSVSPRTNLISFVWDTKGRRRRGDAKRRKNAEMAENRFSRFHSLWCSKLKNFMLHKHN